MASWCARCVQWLREISLYTTCCCPKLAPPRKACLEMRLQPASSRILSLSLSLSGRMLPAFFDSKLLPCTPNTRTQHLDRAIRAFEAGAGKGIFGSRSKFTDHDSTVASSTVSVGQTQHASEAPAPRSPCQHDTRHRPSWQDRGQDAPRPPQPGADCRGARLLRSDRHAGAAL